jgi:hypothetical protein
MKGIVLALGVGLSTLGLADTASAAGPPRGGNGGYNRSYSNGYGQRGYSNYNRGYSNFNRGGYSYQPYGYSPYRSYGYPAYGYSPYGYSGLSYGRPILSFGLSFIR